MSRLFLSLMLLFTQPTQAQPILRELGRARSPTTAVTATSKRVALMIGVWDYAHVGRLVAPENDIAAMSAVLGHAGWEVHQLANPRNRTEIKQKVTKVAKSAGPGSTVLVYYAGHAAQQDNTNHLFPADTQSGNCYAYESETVRIGWILAELHQYNVKAKVLILDACRDNPFPACDRSVDSLIGDEAYTPDGTLIAFSTRKNSTATDGQGGSSPYTAALSKHLSMPGLTIGSALERTATDTKAATGGQQQPWYRSGGVGELVVMRYEDPGDPCAENQGKPVLDSSCTETSYEMVHIGSGSFKMGSPSDPSDSRSFEKGRNLDEVQHEVRITRDFYLGRTEVTQNLWTDVMGTNPSFFSSCGRNCPVEQVSWLDAARFANALSDRDGFERCYQISGETVIWPKGLDCKGYRFPTEAEWEYAARAGTATSYYWGSSSLEPEMKKHSWYQKNANDKLWTFPHAERSGPQPVGQKKPNEWGLYDMTGNVWEWCWDWHITYPSTPVSNPIGPDNGNTRVVRGGSWDSSEREARIANRNSGKTWRENKRFGLRLARSL